MLKIKNEDMLENVGLDAVLVKKKGIQTNISLKANSII
jgi:hypothetical protein